MAVRDVCRRSPGGRPIGGPDQGRLSPVRFEASGTETHFSNGFDPDPRARRIFDFPRASTLARADVVGGITKDSKKQVDQSLIEVPYLRVANVQRGFLRLDTITTIRVPPAKARSLRLQAGDVLLNEGGDRDKLARGWVWEGQIANCVHQNHVFRARIIDPRLDPYFLSWTTNTLGGRWAERNGKQSVNLASISLSMIRKMPVIVPAAGAAAERVAHPSDRLGAFDRIDAELSEARIQEAALRRSLLAATFSGRLTGGSAGLSAVEEKIEEERPADQNPPRQRQNGHKTAAHTSSAPGR